MKLRELKVRRMPGFAAQGPELGDLVGVNLIVGPNGTGKTTACRAIQELLWPGAQGRIRPLEVESRWSTADGDLWVTLDADRHRCRRGVEDTPLPPLPPAQLAACYAIRLDELLADPGRAAGRGGQDVDDPLAAAVALQMSGGYDLPAQRRAAPFVRSRGHGSKEAKLLAAARQEVSQQQDAQRGLLAAAAGLADLEARRDAAQAAREELDLLERALELADVRTKLREAAAARAGFEPGFARLNGTEGKLLDRLQEERGRTAEERDAAQADRDQAAADLAACELPAAGVPRSELAALNERVEGLKDATEERADQAAELESARAAVRQAAERLGAVDVDAARQLSDADVEQLEALFAESVQLQAEDRALETQIGLLEETEVRPARGDLERDVGLLRGWLRAPEVRPAQTRSTVPLWLATALLVALAVLAGAMVSAWGWALLLPAALVAAWLLWPRPTGPAPSTRADLAARFTGRSPPADWSPEAVRERLVELEQELAAVCVADEKRAQRSLLERRAAELQARYQAQAERWRVAGERLGLSGDLFPTSIVLLTSQLRSFRQAEVQVNSRQARLLVVERQLADRRAAIDKVLERYGLPAAADVAAARARARELEAREGRRDSAAQRREEAAGRLARATGRLAELATEEAQLFAAAGVPADGEATLRERLERYPAYTRACGEVDELERQVEQLEHRLSGAPELRPLDRDALEARQRETRARADGYEALVEELTRLRQQLADARAGTTLEDALVARAQAEADLRDALDDVLLADAGQFLITTVADAHVRESQPAVLAEAARLFATITRGAYALRVAAAGEDRGSAFWALDVNQQQPRQLDELSLGTRLQLLLAVRVAFARHSEVGETLPLLLDEALSSSDADRFTTVVESLLALVRDEDRQVFYFTCQESDAATWTHLCAEAGVPLTRIDLRRVPDGGAGVAVGALEVTPVPPPEGLALREYAVRLGAPGFDPREPVEGAHLAHLVDDADQLYGLLRRGPRTYGELLTLNAAGALDDLVPPAALARLRARADLLGALAAAWQVGRGRPVYPEVLERAAGITPTHLERTRALAEELEYDAAALVAAIRARRIPRFHTSKLDELEAWLIDEGHLDPTPRLTRDEAWSRVLCAMGSHPDPGRLTAREVEGYFDHYWAGSCGAVEE